MMNILRATVHHGGRRLTVARPSLSRFCPLASCLTYESSRMVLHKDSRRSISMDSSAGDTRATADKLAIPKRTRQKVILPSDAVSLVHSGDTVYVSGFVTQGCAELVCKELGDRYDRTGEPHSLTLLFGGGPGDYAAKGLNHMAKERPTKLPPGSPDSDTFKPMVKRTIGGHYGQVPMLAKLALEEKVEAWTLPMGSISRMVRSQSTHSPGHITTVGIGTYVDPDLAGGAVNESAKKSKFHKTLVTKLEIGGIANLMYKSLPINVAIIRGTTADTLGNITLEQESLKCDQMVAAAAARNSGGVTIAQVKRLAAAGSLPSRSIEVPGPMVDCVVLVDPKDHDEMHPMSYITKHDPNLTGEIQAPTESINRIPLDIRKIIGRRAFMVLRMNTVVNLGIGMPEAVAAIAAEEGVQEYLTLSTEPGVFGGLPASGHDFGPATNAGSYIEMNQMFDFVDGGGLDITCLGAAEISKSGDINVSRLSKDRLTGPGGFIDISQSTPVVAFVSPFTAKGLELEIPGDGTLKVKTEGKVRKFVNEVYEKTFSGDEAVRRGQTVYYVTERAVFRRSAKHDTIELIEIADGVDLQKDILDHMDFQPVVSPDLKKMDKRIFMEEKMGVASEMFGSLEERFDYEEDEHRVFLEMFGISINTMDDVKWFFDGVESVLKEVTKKKGKVNIVVNYDGFDIAPGLEEVYQKKVKALGEMYYKSSKRFTGTAFKRAKLGKMMEIDSMDGDRMFKEFDVNKDGTISVEELRAGLMRLFDLKLTPQQLELFQAAALGKDSIGKEKFLILMPELLHGR